MNFPWIFFDLDGTLLDTLPGIQFSADMAIRAILPDGEFIDLSRWIGPPIHDIFQRAFPTLSDDRLDALLKKFRSCYDNEGWQKSNVFNKVPETLIWLKEKGIQSAVITNKPKIATKKILDRVNLSPYFLEVISPDSSSPFFLSKSEMAQFLINKFRLSSDQVLFVGDSMDDYLAAQNCHAKFASAMYGYGNLRNNLGKIMGDFVLESFNEICQILG